uniref:Wall-associated receptor kinase C-terminal domain-containing protein n=1 Tax=Globodera rostochiensis TaxID=31243 RepID=A0A914H3R6_GLORO
MTTKTGWDLASTLNVVNRKLMYKIGFGHAVAQEEACRGDFCAVSGRVQNENFTCFCSSDDYEGWMGCDTKLRRLNAANRKINVNGTIIKD